MKTVDDVKRLTRLAWLAAEDSAIAGRLASGVMKDAGFSEAAMRLVVVTEEASRLVAEITARCRAL